MADQSWAKHVADVLRRNGIRLFATVPDYIVSHVLAAQVPMGRAVTHILDALGIRWIRPLSIAELEHQTDGLVKLCYVSSQPVAIVLPSELTRGKRG